MKSLRAQPLMVYYSINGKKTVYEIINDWEPEDDI